MFLIFRDFQARPAMPLTLTPEEFRHVRARRLAPGDRIHVGNGRGLRCAGILSEDQRTVEEVPEEPVLEKAPRLLYLCTAVPGGKRWDWLLEKAAELGVSHIIPVRYRRSDRARFSPERARRIFEQAGAQSQSFHLPVLLPETDLSELHARLPAHAQPMVLLPEGEQPLREFLNNPSADSSVGVPTLGIPAFIVGPEGGFEPAELEYFQERAWSSYKLGDSILRIETAGVAALALAAALV